MDSYPCRIQRIPKMTERIDRQIAQHLFKLRRTAATRSTA